MTREQRICLEKFLILILRHHPEIIRINLDQNGWVTKQELIWAVRRQKSDFNESILDDIVSFSNKNRFEYNLDGTKIRACQGHSISLDLNLNSLRPPNILYHGTVVTAVPSIMKNGLKKMHRNFVHLSTNVEISEIIGRRRGIPVVLKIDAAAMTDAGYEFFCSTNSVWLTSSVPVEYISFINYD